MKRNPRKLKWTKAHRANAGKEMVCDSTLLFGARRNVPQRYNRELVEKTVDAMKRISEIRARRERVFYKKRIAGKRPRELEEARKLVAENQHLLPPHLRETAAESMETEELADGSTNTVLATKTKRKVRVKVDGHVEDDGDEMELG
jgi:large subunit ribosomal protein L24e